VVLVAARNPLNIGAAARAMSNFGFCSLRVVNPFEIAFCEARSAVGAEELLARAEEYKTVADAVADCSLVVGTTAVGHRELQHRLEILQSGAKEIRQRMTSGVVALVFGSEKRGLSNEDLSHCHWLLHIPTREGHPSMNLGQAVAVCLYEIARENEVSSVEQCELASSGDAERITGLLLDALRASGYVKPRCEAATQEKVRRLVRRLNLQAGDAEVWLGMLRQIGWKLKSGE